jgi:cell wall-associated NlpC family hydrolase
MIGQPPAARVAVWALSLLVALVLAGAAQAAPLPIGHEGSRISHASPTVRRTSVGMQRQRLVARGRRIVRIANRMVGVPYRYGGASPASGFDCSGLVQYVFGRVGLRLPHYTVSQYQLGRPVRGRLLPGDLVFFNGLGHVGIYAGSGKMIEAPRTGLRVRWVALARHGGFAGARRIF